jgi:hypothetical protein
MLGAMSIMAYVAPVFDRFMKLDPLKRGLVMAGETLLIPQSVLEGDVI